MNVNADDIKAAVAILRRGGVILYPTDTVWGIGCDACNPAAVKKIYAIKHREDAKALITLVGSLAQLERTVRGIPDVAYQLIEYSDKPLTIVYDGIMPESGIAPELLAPDGSIGVRVTSETFSQALCKAFGRPIVSTSANISGEKSPTCFAEISKEILDVVDYVCESRRNECGKAVPSTVMRLSEDGCFKVLRP